MWKELCKTSWPRAGTLAAASNVAGGCLGDRPDDQFVNVYMGWAGDHPQNAIGNIRSCERLHSLIDSRRPIPVPLEANQTELGFHHPWCDLAHPNRLPQQFEPQGLRDRAHPVLARRITDATRVDLEAGHR